MEPILHKSEQKRMIAGVCGGLAEALDVPPLMMRLSFILLAVAAGLGIVLYGVFYLMMNRAEAREMARDREWRRTQTGLPAGMAPSSQPVSRSTRPTQPYQVQGRGGTKAGTLSNSFALVMIIAGSGIYLARLGSFSWFTDISTWMNNNLSVNWDAFIPAAMIGIGLVMFAMRLRRA